MKTSTAYASGWVHAILIAAAFGCGGGGGDDSAGPGVTDEDAELAEVIAIVEELGRLYEKNSGANQESQP